MTATVDPGSRRARVLLLTSTYPRHAGDGTPPFVRDLALALATDLDVVVSTPRIARAASSEDDAGVRVERFAYFPRRWEDVADGATFENVRARRSRLLQLPFLLTAQALATARLVRRHRPDVVHVFWIIPQGVAALAGARRLPWVVTSPGVDVYALNGAPWRALKRAVLRRATVVTTMNAEMRDRLIDLGVPPDRVRVLPMGVDAARVRAAAAGVDPVPGRLLFAGRLVEKKGLAVLFDALALLPADRRWSLDVVGDGPLADEMRRRAASFGSRVRFLGQLAPDELARCYGTSEAVVVPSVPAATGDQDGLPVVLLEALSSGRAVVASRLAGLDEAVEDGVSGILVAPGNPNALADALERVLGDPELRAVLGRAAAARAERYDVTSIADRYGDLLRAVADRRSPPA